MKKILYIALLALCAGGFLGGCGKSFGRGDILYNYYVWVNNSSHKISLSLEEYRGGGRYQYVFENVILEPGEKYEETGVTGSGFPPPIENWWNITLLFDDGTYGAEFYWDNVADENGDYQSVLFPEGYDMRYNPVVEENYAYEDVKSPNGCRECPGHRWTYTFTDDDYEAAVEYGQRTVVR